MSSTRKIWTLFFGIITALVIVVSQLFWFQASTFSKKSSVAAEQTTPSEEASQEAYISLPSSSLPSTTNTVEVNHEFSFIHEILFEEESASETTSTLASAAGKFFQTLFRTVISPNAP